MTDFIHIYRQHVPFSLFDPPFPIAVKCITVEHAKRLVNLNQFLASIDAGEPLSDVATTVYYAQELRKLDSLHGSWYPVIRGHNPGIYSGW